MAKIVEARASGAYQETGPLHARNGSSGQHGTLLVQ
jgi:hypothetical protein